MASYFWNILISIDQFINVLVSPILNLLTHDDAYEFGNPDETLSSVMGKNIELGHCRFCGFICKYILHPIDNGHCGKAIERDEEA